MSDSVSHMHMISIRRVGLEVRIGLAGQVKCINYKLND